MTDIVERLRQRRVTRWVHSTGETPRADGYIGDAECAEAADEIARLRDELVLALLTLESRERNIADMRATYGIQAGSQK